MTRRISPLTAILRGAVQAYRLLLSPWFGTQCRFTPTCSAYALEALDQHGAWRGSGLALRRICRCHPWGGMGYDPVPLPPTAAVPASPLPYCAPRADQNIPSPPSSSAGTTR